MSFWLNKRETGSPYERADTLFDEAVKLSHDPERVRDAERCLPAAIGAYRELVQRTSGFEGKRRLAKALWREASVTGLAQGRPRDALGAGQEALEIGREVLQAVAASHAAFDSIVQEVSGAMNDVAQIYHAAGRPKEREQQLIVDFLNAATRRARGWPRRIVPRAIRLMHSTRWRPVSSML